MRDISNVPQCLYRFYDSDDVLLYVGITVGLYVRWNNHNALKPWWREVARATVEHFPDRASVARAEREAIKTEAPKYNVIHNNSRGTPIRGDVEDSNLYSPRQAVTYSFRGRKSGYERTVPLWLYWELDGDPITDDYYQDEISGFELWRLWRKRYSEDVMKIYWYVVGPGVIEAAPGCGFFEDESGRRQDFLSFFTWPIASDTGDLLKWPELPVANKLWRPGSAEKGGFIQEATGWKPGPFQATVDIRLLEAVARV